jgi:translation initiation factor IF-3
MEKFYRVNEKIKISPIILIDETGNNLGPIPLFKAKELALSKSLDLVEVAASSRPPICKIMNFGKFKYDQKVKEKKQKQLKKQSQVKEIRLSCGITDHDMETKSKSVSKFIELGYKVQIRLEFKRRENNHKEIGFSVINKFLAKISDVVSVMKKPTTEGRFLFCLVEPKK